MKEKFNVDDFMTPLENLEQVLTMLEGFHLDERFEDMDDAFELIESYKKSSEYIKRGGGMKKCKLIINKNKETIEAVFYGVFQKAWTHGDSLSVGGYKAGQIAYPIAVVDWGEGLKEVNVADVLEVTE